MKTNKIELAFESIPDKAFIPVERKRDIERAKALSPKQKKKLPRGSADICMISPLGQRRMINRNDVIQKYTYLNGNEINMHKWSTQGEYVILREDNTPAVAMLIPTNCVVNINGATVSSSENKINYLVCFLDDSGNILRESVGVISSPMFKKMFTVLPNEVIERHRNSGNKVFSANVRKVTTPRTAQVNKTQTVNVKNSTVESQSTHPARDTVPQKNVQESYTAVGRLINADQKIVGFVIKSKDGSTQQVDKRQITELCRNKLMTNIVLATKDSDGSQYLRGNNIKISDLPAYNI